MCHPPVPRTDGRRARLAPQGEENGLFQVMGREPEYAEHIGPLVREHRELAELLRTVDVTNPAGYSPRR